MLPYSVHVSKDWLYTDYIRQTLHIYQYWQLFQWVDQTIYAVFRSAQA